MRSKWQMTCPLPETPVSLNASLSQSGASMYGFMVKISPFLQHFCPENYTFRRQFIVAIKMHDCIIDPNLDGEEF